jgi:glutamate synthase domain-containing protein 2
MRKRILLVLVVLFVLAVIGDLSKWSSHWWPIAVVALFVVWLRDVSQRQHTILRNFPIIGHMRYWLEEIRPEIQQYFVETDISAFPIPRIYRSNAYQKAKGDNDTVPFGSELDLYAEDYQWINHSCFPAEADPASFRVTIGNSQCRQPYSASLLNISAMSFGSLSHAAITALGNGAKAGGFYHNTGEGGLSPYHLGTGADIVWQIGTGYFSSRTRDGNFDPELFKKNAAHPQVKMIEIKISQGAKPGHGGVLPAEKVSEEIARIRNVEVGKTVISPPGHTTFGNPVELCLFIDKLRGLSEGKPIGFKFCVGRREEFTAICDAMLQTKIYPDFITVDGGEGGTGAAPFDFINFVGSPLKEGLHFVHLTLQGAGLREHVKIIASGKVMTGFNLFEKFALGADLCNSARGMMLSMGCIQAYRCNTNKCPTGIATSDPSLVAGLDVPSKSARVKSFHEKTLHSFADLVGAAGLKAPNQIRPHHISRRHNGEVVTLAELI